jgi:hypothetical protein
MFPEPDASTPAVPAVPEAVHNGVPNAGSKVSVTVASLTSDGPKFDATIVYVNPTPGVYVDDPSSFVIATFAVDDWASVSVAELLPGVGSATAIDATVAVFTRFPVLDGLTAVTTTVYVTEPPTGIVIPKSKMFPEPDASNPDAPPAPTADHDGEPNDASNESVTVASYTSDGPKFDATIVYVNPTPGVYVPEPSVFVI